MQQKQDRHPVFPAGREQFQRCEHREAAIWRCLEEGTSCSDPRCRQLFPSSAYSSTPLAHLSPSRDRLSFFTPVIRGPGPSKPSHCSRQSQSEQCLSSLWSSRAERWCSVMYAGLPADEETGAVQMLFQANENRQGEEGQMYLSGCITCWSKTGRWPCFESEWSARRVWKTWWKWRGNQAMLSKECLFLSSSTECS